VLAVDEPTNHLDAEAQDLLFSALSAFGGVGLLVSHDRNLLDEGKIYPGNALNSV